jgi:NAD(P)-dependent dehydrogenase (short-subunit alcohol dehydrogenase family)
VQAGPDDDRRAAQVSQPQVWLVTGSSRGLGRGLVETVALDVTNPAAAHRAVRAAVDTFGRLDVVARSTDYPA